MKSNACIVVNILTKQYLQISDILRNTTINYPATTIKLSNCCGCYGLLVLTILIGEIKVNPMLAIGCNPAFLKEQAMKQEIHKIFTERIRFELLNARSFGIYDDTFLSKLDYIILQSDYHLQ